MFTKFSCLTLSTSRVLMLFITLLLHREGCTESINPKWSWLAGNELVDRESTEHQPGGRSGASTWHNPYTNITWVFGGQGFSQIPSGKPQLLNELWQFSGINNKNAASEQTYFTKVLPKSSAVDKSQKLNLSALPAARYHAAMCGVDQSLILYGGFGEGDTPLGDMWIYNMEDNTWREITSAGNTPLARGHPAVWCFGPFMFVFGGHGERGRILSDLWRFNLVSHQWTILQDNFSSDSKDHSDLAYRPAGRNGPATWVSSDVLYMFGGNTALTFSYSMQLSEGLISDLWRYFPCNYTWELMSGSGQTQLSGFHEGVGVYSKTNRPGARISAGSWLDPDGALWLFGGAGVSLQPGEPNRPSQILSDLWKFDTRLKAWAFMGGPNEGDVAGMYGEKGKNSGDGWPGGRAEMAVFPGNFVYGGKGLDALQRGGYLNDLWHVDIPPRPFGISAVSLLVFLVSCSGLLLIGLFIGLSDRCLMVVGDSSGHHYKDRKQSQLDNDEESLEPFV